MLLPEKNRQSLYDVPESVLEALEIVFVDEADAVLEHALEQRPVQGNAPVLPGEETGECSRLPLSRPAILTSVGRGTPYPPAARCEIAVVGKSNVGKSSLINSLCNNFKLAKTSQTPGKTRLINFFLLNRDFYLVDLPGYGFARAGKEEQRGWGELIESYLGSGRVTHLFLLLDIRHAPTQEDRQMFEWVLYYGVPFTLVATKADQACKVQTPAGSQCRGKAAGRAAVCRAVFLRNARRAGSAAPADRPNFTGCRKSHG